MDCIKPPIALLILGTRVAITRLHSLMTAIPLNVDIITRVVGLSFYRAMHVVQSAVLLS